MAKVFEIIHTEEFDPVEARITYLIDSFLELWEQDGLDEYADMFDAMDAIYAIWQQLHYPKKEYSLVDRVESYKLFKDVMKEPLEE